MRDQKRHKEYEHQWYLRKKAGLPTKTTIKLTDEEIKKHIFITKKKFREKRRIERTNKIRLKFGERCNICNDTYYLHIHKKDGTKHKTWTDMTNEEFDKFINLNSNDYVQLCYNCHKAVHWCMYYLSMCWEEIKNKAIPTILLKNKYHM